MKIGFFHFDLRLEYQATDIRRMITGRGQCGSNPHSELSIQDKIDRVQRDHSRAKKARQIEQESLITEHAESQKCPKCHSEVVTRMAMKGEHIGERFLMCRKYPYCDYRVPLNQVKPVNMNSVNLDSESRHTRKGFNDWI